jgi:glycine/D-amino acid oxidase-like deaminating enzyme
MSKGGIMADAVRQRLEYLRGELRAERISYGEIAELQELAEHISPDDTELLEAAGVPELTKGRVYKVAIADAMAWELHSESLNNAITDAAEQALNLVEEECAVTIAVEGDYFVATVTEFKR